VLRSWQCTHPQITARDYLETALMPVEGEGPSIRAKNEIRGSIKCVRYARASACSHRVHVHTQNLPLQYQHCFSLLAVSFMQAPCTRASASARTALVVLISIFPCRIVSSCRTTRSLFPDRDCFSLVRPMNDEQALANLNNVPRAQLRPEFLQVSWRAANLTVQAFTHSLAVAHSHAWLRIEPLRCDAGCTGRVAKGQCAPSRHRMAGAVPAHPNS
jgi:hypothetical protein